MDISYSLTPENKVKISMSREAINTPTETRDAYSETKVLNTKAKVLESLNLEKTECEKIINSYTQKRDKIIEAITSVTALEERQL